MDKIYIKKLYPDSKLPSRAHENDAGIDIYTINDVEIKPGEQLAINTGIACMIPNGYVALVRDKSGIANRGLKTLGGVIDSEYRGEYKIIMRNFSSETIYFQKGDKIAQILIQKVYTFDIEEVEELDNTSRGDGHFGSTGK